MRTVGPSAVVATAESESAVGIFGAAVSLPLEGSIAITVSSAVPTSSRPPATYTMPPDVNAIACPIGSGSWASALT